jgi:hypothetical protein
VLHESAFDEDCADKSTIFTMGCRRARFGVFSGEEEFQRVTNYMIPGAFAAPFYMLTTV